MGGGNARNNFSRNTRIVRGKNIGKKNRLKKVRKEVLYIHTNIVTKKWGEKRAKQFFQKHTNSASKKCWEKIVPKKCENTFFMFTRLSWPKKGWKKRAIQIFQKHTNCENKKCWKNSSQKSAKTSFLYSHEYRDVKMGGKNARNNFSRNTRIVRAKNVGKKIV